MQLGIGTSLGLLSNQQLQAILDPSEGSLPYIYDQFETWGSCTVDFGDI